MERIGHYEIVRRLGHGGMGEVFEAIDIDLGRRVALKFVSGPRADDEEAQRRFEREARAAAALQHPGIATLYSFEREAGRPFLVMELLAGPTLRAALAAGSMGVPEALALIHDVAAALAFAHRHGVVHRDIKPENLMFDADGAVKITDFGLARTADSTQLTRTGDTLGTAAYMAPELLRGSEGPGAPASAGAPGAPADVFALGVTAYEMLARELPFRRADALATMYAIAHEVPRALRERRADVPAAIESLVAQMLEKDPDARPSAREVTEALELEIGAPDRGSRYRWSAPIPDARELARRAAELEHAATLPVGGVSLARRRRWARWAGAGVLAATLVLAAWLSQRGSTAASERAIRLNNAALDSLRAGRLEPARRSLEGALALSPGFDEARLNLATVLHRLGQDDRAAALYGAVLRSRRSHGAYVAAAHYGLGEIDLAASAWPSAIQHLREAARRDSSRAEYGNNLAFALLRTGRNDDALAELKLALARFPSEPALLKNVALAWLQAAQYDSAERAASEAIRLRPGFAAAWAVRVRVQAARGDVAGARASLATLRGLGPDSTSLAEAEMAVRVAAPATARP